MPFNKATRDNSDFNLLATQDLTKFWLKQYFRNPNIELTDDFIDLVSAMFAY